MSRSTEVIPEAIFPYSGSISTWRLECTRGDIFEEAEY
jgi:hypothetical protein